MTYQAYGPKKGPLHGLPISTPYVTKDHLQLKRFQAQTNNGTTYVYDFPEMFRQVCIGVNVYCGIIYRTSIPDCRPSGCTVVSGIVVVIGGVCNCSQMRTSKCICLIFGVSIGLDPG